MPALPALPAMPAMPALPATPVVKHVSAAVAETAKAFDFDTEVRAAGGEDASFDDVLAVVDALSKSKGERPAVLFALVLATGLSNAGRPVKVEMANVSSTAWPTEYLGGTSMMLIGESGCGKSNVLNATVRDGLLQWNAGHQEHRKKSVGSTSGSTADSTLTDDEGGGTGVHGFLNADARALAHRDACLAVFSNVFSGKEIRIA